VLAGVVGGTVGDPPQPGDRGDVDDRSAAGAEHHRAELLAQEERSGQVHLQHLSPLRRGGLLGRGQQRDAGVVDQHAGAAELSAYLLDQGGDVGLGGDVTDGRQRLGAAVTYRPERLGRLL
jgi:hypothetical protein